jgi:hypothetical protein
VRGCFDEGAAVTRHTPPNPTIPPLHHPLLTFSPSAHPSAHPRPVSLSQPPDPPCPDQNHLAPIKMHGHGLKGALLGMGNPLLDVSSNVDQAFLDKYEVRRRLGCAPALRRLRRVACDSPRAQAVSTAPPIPVMCGGVCAASQQAAAGQLGRTHARACCEYRLGSPEPPQLTDHAHPTAALRAVCPTVSPPPHTRPPKPNS